MQGGGQFPADHTSGGLDYAERRAYDEAQDARPASRARRHRPRHRQHFGWLRLGRRKQHEPHQHHAAPGPSAHRGSGHDDSHGY
jgi:hypothetical protein